MSTKCLHIIGVVLFLLSISGCKQKHQDETALQSPENRGELSDSITLPVTVLATSYGIPNDKPTDYPKTINLEGFDSTATPIGVYGAADAIWLGPKGYTGSAAMGADGSVSVCLFRPGGNDSSAPYVRYQSIPACMGCMMSAAAPYFENAKADLLNNYDSAMLDVVSVPKALVIQKKSPTLVTYTCTGRKSERVIGVVYYSSQNDSTGQGFEQAEFALGTKNKALTELLVKRYVSMWQLK